MKKLLQFILILSILIFTTAFRWYQKPHIPLSPNDIIPIEDASNNYDTSHVTFNDIIIYFDAIYQSYGLILESIAAGVIDVNLDNTAYPWTDNEIASSANWNTAYTERREWDGSDTHLVASIGRTSLGLGSAAVRDAEDTLSDGSNLPDGHAVKTYGDSNWGAPSDAKYIVQQADATLSAEQALGTLATGIMKSTNGTGIVSIAVEGIDYLAPARIDDTKGNGDTGYIWSADKSFDEFELRCLESVFGTSIGTGLLLDSTILKTSATLQKYHGVDPSTDVLAMLASGNDTAILNSIGDGIVTLVDTTLTDADYLPFWDYSDNSTLKRVDADELRNVPASTTLAGEIAIATIIEVNTGTNATIAVTPDALAGSIFGQKDIGWAICDSDTNSTIANGKKGYCVPNSMADMELINLTCGVADLNSASGGTTTVMMRRVRAGTSADMLSVAVTLSHNEYEAHDATVDVNNDDLNRGDLLYFDVDAITSGYPQKGLSCTALVGIP